MSDPPGVSAIVTAKIRVFFLLLRALRCLNAAATLSVSVGTSPFEETGEFLLCEVPGPHVCPSVRPSAGAARSTGQISASRRGLQPKEVRGGFQRVKPRAEQLQNLPSCAQNGPRGCGGCAVSRPRCCSLRSRGLCRVSASAPPPFIPACQPSLPFPQQNRRGGGDWSRR